jgi:hypothetical protein
MDLLKIVYVLIFPLKGVFNYSKPTCIVCTAGLLRDSKLCISQRSACPPVGLLAVPGGGGGTFFGGWIIKRMSLTRFLCFA